MLLHDDRTCTEKKDPSNNWELTRIAIEALIADRGSLIYLCQQAEFSP
jgi:hypothetical protein